jgi:hypothetical protein
MDIISTIVLSVLSSQLLKITAEEEALAAEAVDVEEDSVVWDSEAVVDVLQRSNYTMISGNCRAYTDLTNS